jgi:spore maturation protein CgeB
MPQFLSQNLSALRRAQPQFFDWLRNHPSAEEVTTLLAEDGTPILVIDGQSQDSRRNPSQAADHFLSARLDLKLSSQLGCWLLGLGSPILLAELLKKTFPVYLLEPRSAVILKALAVLDVSEAIERAQLVFQTRADLGSDKAPLGRAQLIVHPPSGRVLKSYLCRLESFLAGRDQKTLSLKRDPKILIIGPFSGGSLSMGSALLKAGQALNLAIELLTFSQRSRALAQALAQTHQFGSSEAAATVMSQAFKEIHVALDQGKPDLVLVLAQAPLTAETLWSLKKDSDSLWAFWFVEDYRIFHYVEEVAPLYDLFFHIQGPYMKEKIQHWGLQRAWYLPPAADPLFFRPRIQTPPEYRAQVSFMGAGYPNRRRILADLLTNYWLKSERAAEDFKIFGSGWANSEPVVTERLFEKGRRVSPEECSLIYAGSQINLNIHSSNGFGFHPDSAFVNPRTFELAASGAFQLVDRRPLLAEVFSEEEVAVLDQPEQLPEKIEYYLARPKLRQDMGAAARARVIAQHQYTHRLEAILERAQGLKAQ